MLSSYSVSNITKLISAKLAWLAVATVDNSDLNFSLREFQEDFLMDSEYINVSRLPSALVKHISFGTFSVNLATSSMDNNHSCLSLCGTLLLKPVQCVGYSVLYLE